MRHANPHFHAFYVRQMLIFCFRSLEGRYNLLSVLLLVSKVTPLLSLTSLPSRVFTFFPPTFFSLSFSSLRSPKSSSRSSLLTSITSPLLSISLSRHSSLPIISPPTTLPAPQQPSYSSTTLFSSRAIKRSTVTLTKPGKQKITSYESDV